MLCISPHAGSNHGPFAYEASALPLSYRGIFYTSDPYFVSIELHIAISIFLLRDSERRKVTTIQIHPTKVLQRWNPQIKCYDWQN